MAETTTLYGDFDYIIAGAGSAGCLLANRLSADPSCKVLLLEAGGDDKWRWLHIPVGYLYCIGNPRTDWCFTTHPDAGLNGRSIAYPRGRVLGGSSAINGMIYMRGQKEDYDGWRDAGNPGWGWSDVLPLFKKFEHHYAGDTPFHGARGELRVEQQRLRWDILDAFRQAAEQAGIPHIDDFNCGDNEGSSYFQVTQKKGVRFSAATAFLRPIKDRSNLTVITDAMIDRINVKERIARGLRFRHNNHFFHANARREVILSAGAIGSVQILQRSGVGSGDLMKSLGIPLVHHLPGVGRNLQDHLQLRMIYKVNKVRTLNSMMQSPLAKAFMGLQYAFLKKGPLTMAPSQLGIFARSSPRQPRANVQYHVQPLSLEKFGDGLHSFPAFTASVCNIRPGSRGTVNIVSPSLEDRPDILCNYLSTDEDVQVALESIQLTRQIAAQAALEKYTPQEFRPGPLAKTDDDLIRAASDIGTTIFHPVGTCKMGADNMAVVDANLCVHGVGRLRVVDASIMPTITSGNTNAPVMLIAEKAAQLILDADKG
ncbi:GMC family oxidoreductase [Advenella mimigardefordensis]|uniref:Alcohol dehydrogenase n=1 Tax=Advenella mimigardefordensis (strain DSM 17166 / LMG 22922 / DPN7) TaxID=1247726 RepID=W0PA69_ADVMD|nr:GMC family oxidoreductase N-terminal domain-containing protein [Advenella mimigardefordensis]AHG63631.1 alcohol dehydrogenase [Advenella mimigardefordensis DPN7]